MELHSLVSINKKNKKRIGRGTSSGTGKTAGKGQKGQKVRSGGGTRPGFEGGQTPLFRRLPKFGFTNINTKKYTILGLDDLEKLNLGVIDHKVLVAKKIIKSDKNLVKILCNGKITKKINLTVDKISSKARKAIIAAGGSVRLVKR